MPTNWYMILIAGLIPIIIGAIYYSDFVANKQWMKVNGFTNKDLEGGNMALTFGLAYLFSCMIAFVLTNFVIHQSASFGMFMPGVLESGSESQQAFNELMANYGHTHRDFGHGVAHGIMASLFIVTPIIATISLFERRGWKYVIIHSIYWLICLALMGGLLCETIKYAPLQ